MSGLETYNAKRDFARTKEPAGTVAATGGNSFVVQKHAATRLHWDFRLELGGVLLSWAVTRGPSTDPEDKRLAVRTEDHPLGYGSFEGTIPKGQYGGGTVMLWDRGTWEPQDDPVAGLAKGKLHFTLHGERMQGEWVLVRLHPRPKEKHENWLLRKIADDHATGDLVAEHLTSVASARDMDAIAAGGDSWVSAREDVKIAGHAEHGADAPDADAAPAPAPRKRPTKVSAKPLPSPAFREPQLATLVDRPPPGNDWLHETKYDGYRAQTAVANGQAVVYTRSGLDWTPTFGAIGPAAAKLPCRSALIDGEIVALDDHGRPDFSLLRDRLGKGGALLYFAFDLLELDGEDLAHLPLTERKARLAVLLEGADPVIHYAEHVRGGGEAMFEALCGSGYEGVVSKKADGRYKSGRTGSWLKAKCTKRQEFVIGGWSASTKGRGFASLLLGVQEADGLRYVGRVGTGFDDKTLADLSARFEATAVTEQPFIGKLAAMQRRGAHWVRPELVAEIAFAEMTADGNLRHASFLGLRGDKPAAAVVREVAQAPAADLSAFRITHPERIVFPEIALTKGALAAYYATLADYMLPVLVRRPVSLVRCPQGRAKACFFQKHDSGMFGSSVHHVDIRESDGTTEAYLYVEDTAGLMACVQMGTIEFHGWGSTVDALETPDRLVIDLDPDTGLDFAVVKTAAVLIRDRLRAAGLDSAPMLTGGKGVHVVAPLVPSAEWPAVKAWARDFAEALAGEMPDAFVATMSKAKRTGRIFIDYLRNQRGATAVLPYSVRAREGAGVAVPLTWAELDAVETAAAFTAADPAAVLAHAGIRRKPAKAAALPVGAVKKPK